MRLVASENLELKNFAKQLDETWELIDLRSCAVGDGFSWGRYGPTTITNPGKCWNNVWKGLGEKRIFACQHKCLGRRFLDALS